MTFAVQETRELPNSLRSDEHFISLKGFMIIFFHNLQFCERCSRCATANLEIWSYAILLACLKSDFRTSFAFRTCFAVELLLYRRVFMLLRGGGIESTCGSLFDEIKKFLSFVLGLEFWEMHKCMILPKTQKSPFSGAGDCSKWTKILATKF